MICIWNVDFESAVSCNKETKQAIIVRLSADRTECYAICLKHTRASLNKFESLELKVENKNHLERLIDTTPIAITKGGLYRALAESSKGFVQSNPELFTQEEGLLHVIELMEDHLFGNLTMALQLQEKQEDLPKD